MSSYRVGEARGAHAWYRLTRNISSLVARLAVLTAGAAGGPPPQAPPPGYAGAIPPNRSASRAVSASNAARYLLR